MEKFLPYALYYPEISITHHYLENSAVCAQIFPSHFSRSTDYLKQIEKVQEKHYDRNRLCEELKKQNRQFQAGERTFSNIEKLRQENTFVVIAGQQAGIFSGPLFTIYKILTAVKLAQQLSERTVSSVVPVFWIATDDHDFAEINHIILPDQNGTCQTVALESEPQLKKLSISEIVLPSEIDRLIATIEQLLPASENAENVLNLLKESYRSGVPVAAAFGRLLQAVLQDYGLILVDPSTPALKRLGVPLFAREILENSPVSAAVLEQTRIIERLGFSPQIPLKENILNLFYHTPGREALFFTKDRFFIKNSEISFTKQELLGLLEDQPEKFSPNAAFRPLFQDSLFPTLAFVLGPSELAYFAQLKLAYEKMAIPQPIAFPRVTCTFIEPRAQRLLQKYQLSLEELYSDRDQILNKVIKKEIPDELFAKIESGMEQVGQIWRDIQSDISGFDPNLKKPAEIAASRSQNQFDFIRKKIMQAARKKNELIRNQIEKLLTLLLPDGKPQERVFNFLAYYSRFGDQFIQQLYERFEVFNTNHHIVIFEKESGVNH